MPPFNLAFNYNILPPWQAAAFYLSKLSGKCLLLFCLEIGSLFPYELFHLVSVSPPGVEG